MGAAMGKNGGTLLDSLPSTQGTMHIVMLGLDSAGKTTALYRLKFDQYLNTVPTIGFNCEKIRGTFGKAKGVHFLVWDVGGQEKLRPLWRSYTRCTDGIVFVLDSVDVERMEEAKMELMRTAKCPDNQGVPVLILANKQDLPGAREPKELEKLLGLHELSPLYPSLSSSISSQSSPNQQNHKSGTITIQSSCDTETKMKTSATSPSLYGGFSSPTSHHHHSVNSIQITTTTIKAGDTTTTTKVTSQPFKGWFIQPACAITGEGLQEGLDALYEMIIKKRKMNKATKKKR